MKPYSGFYQGFISASEKLQGEWEEDNCPFEFATLNKKLGVQQKMYKSVNSEFYALLESKKNSTKIDIYKKKIIKSIKVGKKSEYWNFIQMAFTSQYLYVISDNQRELYYQNDNQKKYFTFEHGLIQSLRYKNNQLYLVVSESSTTTLNRYIIDQNFKLQLIMKIHSIYIPKKQFVINEQHPVGFFVQMDNIVSLISNQTLKRMCTYFIPGSNHRQLFLFVDFYSYLLNNFIFFDFGNSTLMLHLQSSKIIRKIKNLNQVRFQGVKQLFHHFLISCRPYCQITFILEIYDFKEGRFVAQVQIAGGKDFYNITITDEYLMTNNWYDRSGWKIKQQDL